MSRSSGRKNIVILGSTGSVGANACRVAEALKDHVCVTGVAARSSVAALAEQARKFNCLYASVSDESKYRELKSALPSGCKALCGREGLLELASAQETDLVECSIVGTEGLFPVLEAIRNGKAVALASKEVLVMAGCIVMPLVKRHGTDLLPVDSEHSAIFQCLGGLDSSRAKRIILTSSGGPFRKTPVEEMRKATWEKAIAHPVWSMGEKVSLDSATLMNKALEMVEAHFLFGCPEEKISVIVHPQAKIHSMVEFKDGSILAQISKPDMRFPIQYAFTWPDRLPGNLPALSLTELSGMEFLEPDTVKFPSLDYAREAIRQGGTMTCVLNAANEAAFTRFKAGNISFTDIWKLIEKTMRLHHTVKEPVLEDILAADKWARETASVMEV